jgi:hypothetical protein
MVVVYTYGMIAFHRQLTDVNIGGGGSSSLEALRSYSKNFLDIVLCNEP